MKEADGDDMKKGEPLELKAEQGPESPEANHLMPNPSSNEVEDTDVPTAARLERTPSGTDHASVEHHSDRRIMGAAATIGGTAGMLLMGPACGVALTVGAVYATSREGSTGSVARKAGALYLQVADRAVDEGLQALDHGLESLGRAVDEGRRRLSDRIEPCSGPAPLRAGLRSLLVPGGGRSDQQGSANSEESRLLRQKYPDRIPVICKKSSYSELPAIPKSKFIVPGTMLCGEFKYIVHKHIAQATTGGRINMEKTIYIFVNGITPKTSILMSELYEQFRADDGFLYISYGAENTLG
eukprot:CAMPEP_0115107860 /NCGR_PEP_ID=MMETSP0227-20121206/37584_1 /TAXON_ID=89957 /ORGANISM="Polarella glacialis, Strain CCMP 1383" /LENGTH=297 /DNA_ID=CAMNT_0002505893 /DNA_START=138 /DNA_END=1031 /DNA_ORIENTATION=-